MAPSNTDIKKSEKPSYLKRKRKQLGRRFENKRYERLKKSMGTDAMGLRIQKLLSDFELYKVNFHNKLNEQRQKKKQSGGKKTKRKRKRKNKKKRRKTRKR